MAKSAGVNEAEMVMAARSAADDSIRVVLDEQFPDWFKAFRAAFAQWVKENPEKEASKFSFKLGLGVKIQPTKDGAFEVSAQSGYSIRHKVISNAARLQLELNLGAAKAA